MDHRTNTLRYAFLLSSIRHYLHEIKENMKLAQGMNLKYETYAYKSLKEKLDEWEKEMEKIKWVEP